jgi:hypothetical protein
VKVLVYFNILYKNKPYGVYAVRGGFDGKNQDSPQNLFRHQSPIVPGPSHSSECPTSEHLEFPVHSSVIHNTPQQVFDSDLSLSPGA